MSDVLLTVYSKMKYSENYVFNICTKVASLPSSLLRCKENDFPMKCDIECVKMQVICTRHTVTVDVTS